MTEATIMTIMVISFPMSQEDAIFNQRTPSLSYHYFTHRGDDAGGKSKGWVRNRASLRAATAWLLALLADDGVQHHLVILDTSLNLLATTVHPGRAGVLALHGAQPPLGGSAMATLPVWE